MNNETLTPTDVAITAFGGVRPMARLLACDPSAVCQWRKSGMIPSGRHRKILELAWARGIDLTAHDLIFGREA